MNYQKNIPFTWQEREDGYTEIIQGCAPVRDILYEIARQAYRVATMESELPEQPQLPGDNFLGRFFPPLHFPVDGRTIIRTRHYGTDTLFDMDYPDSLPVKAVLIARDGKLLFCRELFDRNHRANHTQVLRTANMALETRL